jgi:8-oxo-dGTP diphosphatase
MSGHAGEAEPLHVVAAVIEGGDGRILIARRADHRHQGGLWEFPGGKVEPGEGTAAALSRELDEELGITVAAARPLIRVPYTYPDRRVLLDVWKVTAFGGEPHGREGQPLRWVAPAGLPALPFPAANLPIVTAARLPDRYLITPDPGTASRWEAFLAQLEQRLDAGIRLLQLRAKTLSPGDYARLAVPVAALCRRHGASLLVSGDVQLAKRLGCGLHLPAHALATTVARPVDAGVWLSAACHDGRELQRAVALGADFVVVSPVLPTATHPEATPLGWERFQALCEASCVPVYALGGVGAADLGEAWLRGGQGVAGIRALWGGLS